MKSKTPTRLLWPAAACLAVATSTLPLEGADLCQGLPQDKQPRPMTALSKPALGQAVVDPQFGARIRRIAAVSPSAEDPVIKPMYSTVSAWNADESRLILYRVGGGHELYDGRTYAFIRALDIDPPGVEQVYWHTSDPDVLFYPTGNRLVRYHVSTALKETVRSFDFCAGPLTAGDDPMFMSWDSSAIGLKCGDRVFIYRIDSNSITALATTALGPPQIAPSGTLAFLDGYVLDLGLRVVGRLDLANPYEHASLGRTASGRDTYDGVAYDPGPLGSGVGSLVTFDLLDGSSRVIVGPSTGYPYPPSGTHVSALAYREPGWVFLSIVGDPAGQGVLDNELLLADTNTGGVCRAAHHRSWGKHNTYLANSYWAEPHVVPSPTGTRALFASDWGNGPTVDTYVLELPSYRPLSLSVTTNKATYSTGDRMVASVSIINAGAPETVDVYFLWVLPDGDQAVVFTPSGAALGRLSRPTSLSPLATAVSLRTPFQFTRPDFLSFTWTGREAPGAYALILAAIRPGALADNRFDPGDVPAAAAATLAF